MLFANDDDFRRFQQDSARPPKGITVAPDELRREAIADARELRTHRRWRQFAFLLFVGPLIAAVVSAGAYWLVAQLAAVR